MPSELTNALQAIGVTILAVMGVAGVLALILFIIMVIQVRKINVPPGAGFGETLLYTPLIVVLFLDVMDLALDFLGAPIAWVILDRLGLKALRAVAAVEAVIPFTQVIPVMTISWIGARLLGFQRIDAIESMGSYSKYMHEAEAAERRGQAPERPIEIKALPPGDDYDYYTD